ncbi:hypothetical protein SUGI_0460340 [Cryptomeria japonica]|uniref:wall-associated receptor kinase 1-like n=1 Tax=Cryptomeria japonica TaxID=3369 RepID=UPI002408A485|nr:wall-associated receptor kinase 1-like [Cryptomeria japonica]GLJ24133.1 hypothetical protein SUGI_0460340 [Cryptomeria japonica]
MCLVGLSAAKCDPEICGSMNVSYPFWIKNSDCGYPGFQIKCRKKRSTGMQAPFFTAYLGNHTDKFLPPHQYEIMKIDYMGYLMINSTSLKLQSCETNSSESRIFQPPNGGPFTISMSNKFVVIGCKTFGTYAYGNLGDVRCVSLCKPQSDPPYCRYGCCEVSVPDNSKWFNFTGGGVFRLRNSTTNNYEKKCGFSTILDPSTFTVVDNETSLFWGEGRKAYYGLRLNWSIGSQNCSMVKETANYSCSINAKCIDSPTEKGHVCKCLPGYEGNGYLNGTDCIDIDECSDKTLNMCVGQEEGGICLNLAGSYNCSCAHGYKGDGFTNGKKCLSPQSKTTLISGLIGSISSFIVVSMVACGLFWCLRRRRLKNAKERNFRQNGGLLLQERIASMGGRKGLRIFSERELQIASKNYSIELGKGGFATVYKGVLADGLPVAIKKPNSISDEFINEIIILSHIHHRNVVKLFGCCMETQFPLLVYEFVPNGTVYQHLHSGETKLSWQTRRQIAIETAEAISYMHLQASQPIFHRDIKSSNILLDETLTPKVADFGLSRLRPSEEMHLSTMAVGTRGYVDPDFVRSNQFTDKSDVFSFGVVLVELLTGLTPLLSTQGSMCALYDHFLSALDENRLTEILDQKVMNEENQGQMESMARLAKACLQKKARARPSMREVVEELAWIRAATRQSGLYRDISLVEHTGDSKQSPLNYHALLTSFDGDYQDLNPFTPVTAISSEDPSTALIQIEMPDKNGR